MGVLAEKKASNLILWDSSTRATKGKLGAPDGTSILDRCHPPLRPPRPQHRPQRRQAAAR